MKRTTKKLSGIGLELFLRRYFASYSGVDEKLARRLSQDGAKTFASVRIRRMAWHDWRRRPTATDTTEGSAKNETPPPAKVAAKPVPARAAKPAPAAATADTGAAFDPYAIGLIPTYQREGADGLGARLAEITSLANLRKMARSQQIALPAELRGEEANIDDVRTAIVDAVGKRIANRRAAAG